MDIYALNDAATQITSPAAQRAPDKIVLSLSRTDTDPRQGDMMNPGAGQSQAGLIAEALILRSDQTPDGSTEPERVLKPWGIAMLPEDSQAERESPQDAEAPNRSLSEVQDSE